MWLLSTLDPDDNLCSKGSVKPAVLPVPVCAIAMTSRPLKMAGMAFSCIGDGSVYPLSEIAFIKGSDKPRESKLIYFLKTRWGDNALNAD